MTQFCAIVHLAASYESNWPIFFSSYQWIQHM